MDKRVYVIVNRENNSLDTALGYSQEDASKDGSFREIRFHDSEEGPANRLLLGERALDLPEDLMAYADALQVVEQSLTRFLPTGYDKPAIEQLIEYAIFTGFRLGVAHADEIRARRIGLE